MMDEDRMAGDDAQTTTETGTVTTQTTTPAVTDTGAAGDAASTSADKTDKGADPFGADWRDRLASGLPEDQRGKAQAYLKTRSSPYDILRSGMTADQKISELNRDRIKIPTGKDDDPKDVAAYRKARGVPDEPTKYAVDIPEEVGELSSLDTELKDEFLKEAHARNWGQKDVDFAMKTWFANQKMMAAENANRVLRAQQAAVDELRVEYGKDYRPNIELVNRVIGEEMNRVGVTDANERREVLSKRFADGTALGEQPWFVKMMVNIARERSDDGAFVMGETADGGDLDGRVNKIMDLMHSDPKEYERMQPELQKLIAAQNRRKGR